MSYNNVNITWKKTCEHNASIIWKSCEISPNVKKSSLFQTWACPKNARSSFSGENKKTPDAQRPRQQGAFQYVQVLRWSKWLIFQYFQVLRWSKWLVFQCFQVHQVTFWNYPLLLKLKISTKKPNTQYGNTSKNHEQLSPLTHNFFTLTSFKKKKTVMDRWRIELHACVFSLSKTF